MEAYFHNDSRIEEWIDQITEKVFTVCLLTGIDADVEMQRGSQIVTKVSTILLGISMFPYELLEDGLRQLIEQQLPDDRVIKNFPSFFDILNRMLHEGISKALEGRQEELTNQRDEEVKNEVDEEVINEIIAEESRIPSEVVEEFLCVNSGTIDEVVDEVDKIVGEEIINEIVIPAMATNIYSADSSQKSLEECYEADLGDAKARADLSQKDLNLDEMQSSQEITKHSVHLRHVLNKIFPESSVRWNINIKGKTFMAQVENILIYLTDSEHSSLEEESFIKEGWKLFGCSREDLSFPRRVEREIRMIIRSGKKSIIL
jgi:hypothetical protein